MKKTVLFIALVALCTSCFKSEILDKEESEHFYFSDYYLNDFASFEAVVVEKRLDPITGANPSQIIGYQGEVDIQVDAAYYQNLKQNWNHIILFNEMDISDENRSITIFASGLPGATQSFSLPIRLVNQGNTIATENTTVNVLLLP